MTKTVTQKQIARETGLDQTTVSGILNDKSRLSVRPETRQRVIAAAARLGYQPNRAARALRTGQFRTVGLLMADVMNPFYAAFMRKFDELLEAQGYDLVVGDTQLSVKREHLCLERMRARQVDGIFGFLSTRLPHRAFLEQQWSTRKPVVVIGPDWGDFPVDSVEIDFAQGMTQAVDHLIGLGHRRIAFVSESPEGKTDEGRLVFLRRGLEQHGITLPERYIVRCRHTMADGRQAFAEFFARMPSREWPTAVIAVNDVIAIGLMRAALDHGLKLPEDLSVIGIDNMPLGAFLPIPLTSVDAPYSEMSAQVVSYFFDRVRGAKWPPPRRRVFATNLIVRGSTVRPKKSR